MKKPVVVFALAAVSAFALAGCSSNGTGGSSSDDASAASSDGKVQVAASTNVWGDVASQIGGDHVEVTSIIASLSQDPHEYEVAAADKLKVEDASLIIENGGGYDAFMEDLSKDADGTKITATAFESALPDEGKDDPTAEIEGFNEHVWYDFDAVGKVAAEIADQLSTIDSANKSDYEANLAAFQEKLDGLDSSAAEIKSAHDGEKIFVTEPVPLYMAEKAGLVNVTPEEFSEAVEEGQDVPPATLLEATDLINSGEVKVLFANAQTGGAETTQVIDAANAQNIPVQEVTELVPDGDDYISWMQDNLDTLASNLNG